MSSLEIPDIFPQAYPENELMKMGFEHTIDWLRSGHISKKKSCENTIEGLKKQIKEFEYRIKVHQMYIDCLNAVSIQKNTFDKSTGVP